MSFRPVFPVLPATALALAAGSAPAPAAAQAIPFDLGEIVVSAALEPVAASASGASVSVVTGDEIAAAADLNLVDTLIRLPGVSIRATGPIGAQAGFAVRGASQNYVPVLIDGIDVTDPSGPQVAFNFGGLTAVGIGRIEVLKGSQSALYGADAVGGVISITTARATEEGVHHVVEASAGSYATRRLSYGFSALGPRGDLALTLGHVSSNGFSAADEDAGNTEADGFRGNRASFSGSLRFDTGLRLGASGFYEDTFAEFDESFPAIADGTPDEAANARSRGLRAFAEFETGAIEHTLSGALFAIDRDSLSDGFTSLFEGRREVASWQAAGDIGPARVIAGADTTRETSADSFGFAAENRIDGVFSEVRLAATPALDLIGSVRNDDHSRFGGFTTGRLALAWRVAPGVVVRGSAGQGFRAPSNYELFSDFGNPALSPESSDALDLGIEAQLPGGGWLRATAFHLAVDDLIDFDFADNACGSGFGCYVQVPGTSRRSGLELEGAVALSDRLRLRAAYTFTDSSSNASSAWADVAKHDLVASLSAGIAPRLSGVLSAQHVAGRAGALGSYTVLHGALTWDLGQGAEAWLRVENLTDADYQLVPGFGTSDRAVQVGLRRAF